MCQSAASSISPTNVAGGPEDFAFLEFSFAPGPGIVIELIKIKKVWYPPGALFLFSD
jgi:hypothetical protein